jgi:hypothetical protein
MKIDRWQAAQRPDSAKLVATLESDGYSVYSWTDGAHAVYPLHTHDDDQSHWVVSGGAAGEGQATPGRQRGFVRPVEHDVQPAA